MDPIEALNEKDEDEDQEPSSYTPEELARIKGYAEALKHTHTVREQELTSSAERLQASTRQVTSFKRWMTIAGGALAIIAPCVGGLVTVTTYLWQANERISLISTRSTAAIADSAAAKKLNEETRRDVQEIRTTLLQITYKLDAATEQIKGGVAERAAIRDAQAAAAKAIGDRLDAAAHDREVMAVQQGRMEQQLLDLKERMANRQGNNSYPWTAPAVPLEKAQR